MKFCTNGGVKVDEEQKVLMKWFVQQGQQGLDYEEALEVLFNYRVSPSKSERKIYETFAYMFDEEWFAVRDKVKDI